MSLGKLLSTGRSLIGGAPNEGRYDISNCNKLPKFNAAKNPFAPPAKPAEPAPSIPETVPDAPPQAEEVVQVAAVSEVSAVVDAADVIQVSEVAAAVTPQAKKTQVIEYKKTQSERSTR